MATDADGRIEFEADSWHSLAGDKLNTDDWGWLDAIHPDDRTRVREEWTKAVVSKTAYACQHRVKSPNGYAWVVARAAPIVTPGADLEWIGMMKHGDGPFVVTTLGEGVEVVTTVHNQGLPIPPALLPILGGSIAVSSLKDEGTTFVIRWPRTGRNGAKAIT